MSGLWVGQVMNKMKKKETNLMTLIFQDRMMKKKGRKTKSFK